MNKWLKLSEGLFFFGQGGINRVESTKVFKFDGSLSDYKTNLFIGTTRVCIVKDSEEDILEKLQVNYGL